MTSGTPSPVRSASAGVAKTVSSVKNGQPALRAPESVHDQLCSPRAPIVMSGVPAPVTSPMVGLEWNARLVHVRSVPARVHRIDPDGSIISVAPPPHGPWSAQPVPTTISSPLWNRSAAAGDELTG
jgi:hypothetical protein